MRLSKYPYVVVRIACNRCPRQGQYRLARLADKYGSEVALPALLEMLSADCELRAKRPPGIIDSQYRCGAHFPDLPGHRPPDLPSAMRPKLKVVGG